jgi:predicted permease
MRVVLVLFALIALALLARFVFAKQGARLLQTLFSILALVLGVICAYILFLSIIQGHSLF